MKRLSWFAPALVTTAALVAAACGGETTTSDTAATAETTTVSAVEADSAGIRLVSASEGGEIHSNRTDDVVVLDVRTPEEFAEGHLDGAIMIDFYSDDFAEQVAGLDPDASYLLYCRSGNRSGQTRTLMEQLGFSDVADVDGGIVAWADAGLPLVTP